LDGAIVGESWRFVRDAEWWRFVGHLVMCHFMRFWRFVVRSKLAGNINNSGQYSSDSLDLHFDFFLVPPKRQ
jgi:hypothetical protein